MASTGTVWWMTPLQVLASLGLAVNFGGSVLQSPLIMPMLQIPSVPVHHSAAQTAYLLTRSEHFFPPLNALCTLTNLVLSITNFLSRHRSPASAQKFSLLAIATSIGVATTGYALTVMVPLNRRMVRLAKKLEVDHGDVQSAAEFRMVQRRWIKLNYGRATLMLMGSVIGISALLVDENGLGV